MYKTKDVSTFERGMVAGAMRTALCFHVQQFPVCIKNGPPPKGHPANLTQLWEALESTRIPVEHLTPCTVHAPPN